MAQDNSREGIPNLSIWERMGLNYGTPGGAIAYQLEQQKRYLEGPQREANVALTNARARNQTLDAQIRQLQLDEAGDPLARMKKLRDDLPVGSPMRSIVDQLLGDAGALSEDERDALEKGLGVAASQEARDRSKKLALEEQLQQTAASTGVPLTIEDLSAMRAQLIQAGVTRMPSAQQTLAIQAAVTEAAMARSLNLDANNQATALRQGGGGLESGPGAAGGSSAIQAILAAQQQPLPAGFAGGAVVNKLLAPAFSGAPGVARDVGKSAASALDYYSALAEKPFLDLANFISSAVGGPPIRDALIERGLSDPDARLPRVLFDEPTGPQFSGPFSSATGGRRL